MSADRKTLEQHFEEERCKQNKEVEELQAKLLEAESTISTLETRMTGQRSSCQKFEEQLLEKENGIEKLEQEVCNQHVKTITF